MEIVTVSPKYQVVIPLAIRKALGLKRGQKVEVREKDGHIELVPCKPISAYRGILRGIPPFEREPDREL
ncbi:MAG TPA: AbrB/MazE/SpoVT family DNA-binding domain-containing protein [Tepidiformaceae bacterium]|nr:AbrB/MazE/SpoVT family DNA-binding domain-containing protein [Tepidiformaceae bacterium]HMO95338.1 AbrB/MazE/SpoVT family DNA-binding domain-containing protein [Tepidiformaceae bacterium]